MLIFKSMCIYRGSILYIFITLALLAGIATISNAQSYTANTQSFHEKPRHYICFQTTGPITIDGKPGETAWHNAPWTEDFIDIEGNAKPAPTAPHARKNALGRAAPLHLR